jgi:NADH:ubiquinone oxidoreductase subunit F (NADH-binding)
MRQMIVVLSLLSVVSGEQCSTLVGCRDCVAMKGCFFYEMGSGSKVCSDNGRLRGIVLKIKTKSLCAMFDSKHFKINC